MTEITKPHDLFFKEVFSRPDVAETFVLNFLPPNVTRHFKPNSFRPSQGSFVDERLKEHHSDLLYQVDFNARSAALEDWILLIFNDVNGSSKKTCTFNALVVRTWNR